MEKKINKILIGICCLAFGTWVMLELREQRALEISENLNNQIKKLRTIGEQAQ